MKKEIQYVLYGTSYLAVYLIFFLAGFDRWVSLLFAFSPVVVIWMAIKILKTERDSEKTWEEGFRYDFE